MEDHQFYLPAVALSLGSKSKLMANIHSQYLMCKTNCQIQCFIWWWLNIFWSIRGVIWWEGGGGGAARDLQPNSEYFLPQCSRYKQQQSQGWTPPTFSVMSAVMVSWISRHLPTTVASCVENWVWCLNCCSLLKKEAAPWVHDSGFMQIISYNWCSNVTLDT